MATTINATGASSLHLFQEDKMQRPTTKCILINVETADRWIKTDVEGKKIINRRWDDL